MSITGIVSAVKNDFQAVANLFRTSGTVHAISTDEFQTQIVTLLGPGRFSSNELGALVTLLDSPHTGRIHFSTLFAVVSNYESNSGSQNGSATGPQSAKKRQSGTPARLPTRPPPSIPIRSHRGRRSSNVSGGAGVAGIIARKSSPLGNGHDFVYSHIGGASGGTVRVAIEPSLSQAKNSAKVSTADALPAHKLPSDVHRAAHLADAELAALASRHGISEASVQAVVEDVISRWRRSTTLALDTITALEEQLAEHVEETGRLQAIIEEQDAEIKVLREQQKKFQEERKENGRRTPPQIRTLADSGRPFQGNKQQILNGESAAEVSSPLGVSLLRRKAMRFHTGDSPPSPSLVDKVSNDCPSAMPSSPQGSSLLKRKAMRVATTRGSNLSRRIDIDFEPNVVSSPQGTSLLRRKALRGLSVRKIEDVSDDHRDDSFALDSNFVSSPQGSLLLRRKALRSQPADQNETYQQSYGGGRSKFGLAQSGAMSVSSPVGDSLLRRKATRADNQPLTLPSRLAVQDVERQEKHVSSPVGASLLQRKAMRNVAMHDGVGQLTPCDNSSEEDIDNDSNHQLLDSARSPPLNLTASFEKEAVSSATTTTRGRRGTMEMAIDAPLPPPRRASLPPPPPRCAVDETRDDETSLVRAARSDTVDIARAAVVPPPNPESHLLRPAHAAPLPPVAIPGLSRTVDNIEFSQSTGSSLRPLSIEAAADDTDVFVRELTSAVGHGDNRRVDQLFEALTPRVQRSEQIVATKVPTTGALSSTPDMPATEEGISATASVKSDDTLITSHGNMSADTNFIEESISSVPEHESMDTENPPSMQIRDIISDNEYGAMVLSPVDKARKIIGTENLTNAGRVLEKSEKENSSEEAKVTKFKSSISAITQNQDAAKFYESSSLSGTAKTRTELNHLTPPETTECSKDQAVHRTNLSAPSVPNRIEMRTLQEPDESRSPNNNARLNLELLQALTANKRHASSDPTELPPLASKEVNHASREEGAQDFEQCVTKKHVLQQDPYVGDDQTQRGEKLIIMKDNAIHPTSCSNPPVQEVHEANQSDFSAIVPIGVRTQQELKGSLSPVPSDNSDQLRPETLHTPAFTETQVTNEATELQPSLLFASEEVKDDSKDAQHPDVSSDKHKPERTHVELQQAASQNQTELDVGQPAQLVTVFNEKQSTEKSVQIAPVSSKVRVRQKLVDLSQKGLVGTTRAMHEAKKLPNDRLKMMPPPAKMQAAELHYEPAKKALGLTTEGLTNERLPPADINEDKTAKVLQVVRDVAAVDDAATVHSLRKLSADAVVEINIAKGSGDTRRRQSSIANFDQERRRSSISKKTEFAPQQVDGRGRAITSTDTFSSVSTLTKRKKRIRRRRSSHAVSGIGQPPTLAMPGGLFHIALASQAQRIKSQRHAVLELIYNEALPESDRRGVTRDEIMDVVRVCSLLADGRLEACLAGRGSTARLKFSAFCDAADEAFLRGIRAIQKDNIAASLMGDVKNSSATQLKKMEKSAARRRVVALENDIKLLKSAHSTPEISEKVVSLEIKLSKTKEEVERRCAEDAVSHTDDLLQTLPPTLVAASPQGPLMERAVKVSKERSVQSLPSNLEAEVDQVVKSTLAGLSNKIDDLQAMFDADTLSLLKDEDTPTPQTLPSYALSDDRFSDTQWQLVEATEEMVRAASLIKKEVLDMNKAAAGSGIGVIEKAPMRAVHDF